MSKKNPLRFCVKFSEHVPNHLLVAEILNEKSHDKAQFIAEAILHYVNCENGAQALAKDREDMLCHRI